MKIIAVNGSPRKNHNTGRLLKEALKGAEQAGAQTELLNLYDLDYKGCISCFACKAPKGKSYGRCAVKDGLTPLLDKIHTEASALILGSPFYFSSETGMMRSFMERLYFQYYLYSEKSPISPRKMKTAMLYTMNVKEEDMAAYGKDKATAGAERMLSFIFGLPCEIFLCTNTKQFDDYSKYEVDRIDVPGKLKRYEEVFPKDLARAFELGQTIAKP